jgi:hypothetical protein
MHRAGISLAAFVMPAALIAQQTVPLPERDKVLPEKVPAVYSVGREDGEDWEIFSGVRAAAFDARDNLYLLDANNFRVLVFDVNGKFVRRIARQGAGPGELMVPTGMTVMSDGAIVVSDGGRHAYSLFRSDGAFLRNVPYPDGEGVGGRPGVAATTDMWMDGLHPHPRGGVVVLISPLRNPGRALGQPTGERKVFVRWVDLAASAQPSVDLYTFTLPSITPRVQPLAGGGASVTMQPTFWTPAYSFELLSNGGLVVADEAEYRVRLLNAAGKVERILERPIAPRKGTVRDKEVFIKERREKALQAGGMQRTRTGTEAAAAAPSPTALASTEEMMRNATWLDVIPVLRRVSADPQGRIWVARTPVDFGARGPVDLLKTDGTYIGTLPNAMLPAAVSKSGRAAFIELDDLGVERVVVRQLPATWK